MTVSRALVEEAYRGVLEGRSSKPVRTRSWTRSGDRPRQAGAGRLSRLGGPSSPCSLISALLVFAVELIVRGSLEQTLLFFQQPFRPGWTTVILFALLIVFLDALLGRAYNGLLIVAPVALALAFVGQQKALYLGDPLYPTDFLYARQIVELMPLLVRERPGTARRRRDRHRRRRCAARHGLALLAPPRAAR